MARKRTIPAINIPMTRSPRHAIAYTQIPARARKGAQVALYSIEEYGQIVDTTYEMADAISTSNLVFVYKAIDQVLDDEKWTMLESERKAIEKLLTE